MYIIGRVTLFFANNSIFDEISDHRRIFTQFFLDPEEIFSSHIMFINASTKEFILVNNVIPSYDILYTTRCCECSLYDIENIFKKQYIFYFNLSIVSFHANLKFSQ